MNRISRRKQGRIKEMRLAGAPLQRIADETGVSLKTAHRYGAGLVEPRPPLKETLGQRARGLRARGETFLAISNALGVSPTTAWRLCQ